MTYEGTNDVKRVRKHALIQEYELFKMKQGESIVGVQKRFTHIVNHLMGLGKEFDKEKLNIKVLKCLDRSWQPKVTAISETRDLSTLLQLHCLVSLGSMRLRCKGLMSLSQVRKR